MTPRGRQRGFTLVELVVVIVVGAILAATIAVFLRPALDTWLAARDRAELSAQAGQAMQRMVRDVRTAVPNSLRTPGSSCFELVPTSTGGRLRKGPDTVNDSAPGCSPGASCSAPLDTNQSATAVDVLTPLSSTPAAGDWLVVDNQNPGDVYGGSNRVAITSVSAPAAAYGKLRLGFAAFQFPAGFDSARFVVVPGNQQAVFYVCSGADGTLDAAGNGKGTLYRLKAYGFNAAAPASCPAVAGADVMATNVRSCRFVYDPNQGATQQNGFVSMQLELARNGETASLVMGAHVVNAP